VSGVIGSGCCMKRSPTMLPPSGRRLERNQDRAQPKREHLFELLSACDHNRSATKCRSAPVQPTTFSMPGSFDRATPRPRRSFQSVGRCRTARPSSVRHERWRGRGSDLEQASCLRGLPNSGAGPAIRACRVERPPDDPIASARADLPPDLGRSKGDDDDLRAPAPRGDGFYARLRRAAIGKTLRYSNRSTLWRANRGAVC